MLNYCCFAVGFLACCFCCVVFLMVVLYILFMHFTCKPTLNVTNIGTKTHRNVDVNCLATCLSSR